MMAMERSEIRWGTTADPLRDPSQRPPRHRLGRRRAVRAGRAHRAVDDHGRRLDRVVREKARWIVEHARRCSGYHGRRSANSSRARRCCTWASYRLRVAEADPGPPRGSKGVGWWSRWRGPGERPARWDGSVAPGRMVPAPRRGSARGTRARWSGKLRVHPREF